MSRTAREKSISGIYHIMLRGVNRKDIFHEDKDCLRFLESVLKYKERSGIKIYGWCLMSNHIHLLVGEGNEDISLTMKRIGVSYAQYYNSKYCTVGHLFQDRFRSERIDEEQYLLTSIRYIHQNPVKAGLCENASDWVWSSCRLYYDKTKQMEELLDAQFVLQIFSDNINTAKKAFKNFNDKECNELCLDDEAKIKLSDKEALIKISKIITEHEITEIGRLPKDKRDAILGKIKGIEGVSQRRAARIIGISPNIMFKI